MIRGTWLSAGDRPDRNSSNRGRRGQELRRDARGFQRVGYGRENPSWENRKQQLLGKHEKILLTAGQHGEA
jgi:hypothetical protein